MHLAPSPDHSVPVMSRRWMRSGAAVLALGAAAAAAAALAGSAPPPPAGGGTPDALLLTVAYCPDAFTGAGATVSVDPSTGAWSVLSKFRWPGAIFGYVADPDPLPRSDMLVPHGAPM